MLSNCIKVTSKNNLINVIQYSFTLKNKTKTRLITINEILIFNYMINMIN